MIKLRTLFFIFFLGFSAAGIYAQSQWQITVGKYSDIASVLKEFSTLSSGRANLTADMGLNWSDVYIGDLISFPPHWGIGLSFGVNSVSETSMNHLLNGALGVDSIKPTFADKILFPAYNLEFRIGGFRGHFFDVGIKFGYWPNFMPGFFFGSLKYENMNVGGDVRFNFVRSAYTGFLLSGSLGLNYVSGYLQKSGYTGVWSEEGEDPNATPAPATKLEAGGSDLRAQWSTFNFLLKLLFQKNFFMINLTIFGGVGAGLGFSSAGIALIGDKFIYGAIPVSSMNGDSMKSMEEKITELVSGTKWTISNTDTLSLTGKISTTSFILNAHLGVAVNFDNNMRVQIAPVFDLWQLEYGLSIGFRWQERQF